MKEADFTNFMKILVCVSGASLINCALKLIQEISQLNDENFVIFSKNSKLVLKSENDKFSLDLYEKVIKNKNLTFFDDDDLSAKPSSGSFDIEKTIIAPCSINSLAKINAGICDTLITRSAAVALKEKKQLILGVREMPFSPITCKHLSNLSNLGVIIAPPIIAEYQQAQNLEQMQNFIVGKWLDLLNLKHNLYKKWS